MLQSFKRFSQVLLIAALFGACAAGAETATADRVSDGPTSMIMTYRTAPANRAALRKYMQGTGLRQFQRWKTSGVMRGYRVFFNRYADNDNWDMMTVLTFERYADVAKWNEVERRSPAGLGRQALAWTNSISTTPADLMRSKSTQQEAESPAYVILPYDYNVSTNDYIAYLDGYVVPQYDGWLDEGVMTKYDLYLARYGSARFWSALFILEYRNEEALGSRDKVLAKVRARLREIPSWKAISDSKQNVRVARQYVIADELKLR
ncbi:MAG: hypothetical protein NT159_08680 [Proteobacteria bacterium]|nr:hypothetical protein [Pseudomonadota bacterium]